jgi:hypothetical protein
MIYSKLSGIKEKAGKIGMVFLVVCLERESSTVMLAPRSGGIEPGTLKKRVWVKETMEAMGMDSSSGMPAKKVARAYKESVEGHRNGEVLDVRDFA